MRRGFGTTADGRTVEAVTLSDGTLTVTVLTLGAILNDLRLAGVPYGLTLGTPDLAPYEGGMGYYGAIVGPVANRIAGARAGIAGTEYRFPPNEGRNLLHGGAAGTHARLWDIAGVTETALTLRLTLPDGHGGFPGNRRITARYALAEPGTLELTIEADTDAPTLFNLAQHGYWNLDGTRDYAGHRLRIAADRYLPVDAEMIPLQKPAPVAGTPFDFRAGRVLTPGEGARIDHNFCLSEARVPPRPVLELTGASGVTLAMETTEPGLQVFDGGNDVAAAYTGHGGQNLGPWAGLALEAQCWPDAPNHPGFPPILHTPGAPYRQVTRLRFARD